MENEEMMIVMEIYGSSAERRISELESEGMTRSDAEGVWMAELLKNRARRLASWAATERKKMNTERKK